MADAYLVAQSGPVAGQRFELTSATTTIGRLMGEIVVKNLHVSKQHARITRDGDAYYLADLASRNKTWLNRCLVSSDPVRLRHGDHINVANMCDLIFWWPQADPGPGPEDEFVDDDVEVRSTLTIMSQVDVGSSTSSSSSTTPPTPSPEDKLAALLEIARQLGHTLDLATVLPLVLDSLLKIFHRADRGFIILKTEAGRWDTRWKKIRGSSSADTSRISRKIVRLVMESKQALLLKDARTELLDPTHSVAMAQLRSVLCAPLLDSRGNALGVLQLDTLDKQRAFQQVDLELLASVAILTGIAVENAKFHEWALRQKIMERDLELAHEVQRAILPRARPCIEGYTFFDYYRPMHHVGGDYYDYIHLADGRTAIIVADVVGHGIAAAIMMAKVSGDAKFCLAGESDPATVMDRLNDRICELNIERFVTVLLVVLDPLHHQVTILNAGHMPPIWRRVDGTIEEPGGDISGMPVGIEKPKVYQQKTIELQPGELLAMYTDGIHESLGANDKQFGRERIRQHVRGAAGSLDALGERIIQDVQEYIGTGPQTDDMCLVCLGRNTAASHPQKQ